MDLTQKIINEISKKEIKVTDVYEVSGGSINKCFRVQTSHKSYFLKQHQKNNNLSHFFNAEMNGLKEIESKKKIRIPKVYGLYENDQYEFLLIEFIEKSEPNILSWEKFGQQLAVLHQSTSSYFGHTNNNYIGTLKQINDQKETWSEFYILNRIAPLIRTAIDQGTLPQQVIQKTSALFKAIESIFPTEAPSLLHGDLWSGNILFDTQKKPAIFDPSIYYGHREMDIGMSLLFGGFHDGFYNTYTDTFPLENGWKERVPMTQLYPLLVHLNLFGISYQADVLRVIDRFV